MSIRNLILALVIIAVLVVLAVSQGTFMPAVVLGFVFLAIVVVIIYKVLTGTHNKDGLIH